MYKNIYCANCGKRGHILKNCTGPITSFGIIAFKIVENENDELYDKNIKLCDIIKTNDKNNVYPKVKLLMIQRKDTMGYTDFLRGKYPESDNDVELKGYFSEMTCGEQNMLLNNDFDYCWNTLWIRHDSNGFKKEYEYAKQKFNNIDIKKYITMYPGQYTFTEFSFAKGRKNVKEQELGCAKREFSEETRFNEDDYILMDNEALVEEFIGTDNVHYKHVYYLAQMANNCYPIFDSTDKIQSSEVGNIGWFTYSECIELIRPYDSAKKDIVVRVGDIIDKMFGFNQNIT